MRSTAGQVLLEILIAFLILIFFGLAVFGIVTASLRGVRSSMDHVTAVFLAQETTEALRMIALEDWQNITNLATSSSNHYFATTSVDCDIDDCKWIATSSDETILMNNLTYTRWFHLDDVYRSTSTGVIVSSGGYYDPSVIKATVHVRWTISGTTNTYSKVVYYSRFKNNLYTQTDWSGGAVGEASTTQATTTFTTSTGVDSTSTTGSILLELQ